MRRGFRVSTAMLLVVAVLSACSSSDHESSSEPTRSSFEELEARIVTNLPPGYAVQPDAVNNAGPSNLAKAIKDDGSPGAAKALRDEGFVQGYQRLWATPAGAQIALFIYEFETPEGARQDYERAIRGAEVPPGSHKLVVTDLPKGQAIGMAGTTENRAYGIVNFTTGVYTVQILCTGESEATQQQHVTELAEDQLSRL